MTSNETDDAGTALADRLAAVSSRSTCRPRERAGHGIVAC
jgi:hypothetical protein